MKQTPIIYKLTWKYQQEVSSFNPPDYIEIFTDIDKLSEYTRREVMEYGIWYNYLPKDECYVDIANNDLDWLNGHWIDLVNFVKSNHRNNIINNILI